MKVGGHYHLCESKTAVSMEDFYFFQCIGNHSINCVLIQSFAMLGLGYQRRESSPVPGVETPRQLSQDTRTQALTHCKANTIQIVG